jgi:hypothetical protein
LSGRGVPSMATALRSKSVVACTAEACCELEGGKLMKEHFDQIENKIKATEQAMD